MANLYQYSDTTTKLGLIQFLEKELSMDYGDISGDSDLLYQANAQINSALNNFNRIAIKSSGTWQFDDTSTYETNGTTERGYNVLKSNLISGRGDYQFTTDGSGNYILGIQKLFILSSATDTIYTEIYPSDELGTFNSILTEDGVTGVPSRYGKLANGIFIDPPPNYSVNNGLKMVVDRSPSFFLYNDTTKVAGIPYDLQPYLYLKAAMEMGRPKSLANYNLIVSEVLKYEGDETRGIQGKIAEHFALREKDVRKKFTPKITRFR